MSWWELELKPETCTLHYMHKIVNLQKAFKIANPPIPCMQASTSVYHIQNSKQFFPILTL
jgi:hypothetical protein